MSFAFRWPMFSFISIGMLSCTVPNETSSVVGQAPFEVALAMMSNLMEDAELSTTYVNFNSSSCRRVVTCSTGNYKLTNTFNNCTTLPGVSDLDGTTVMTLDAASCSAFSSRTLPTVNYTATKSYTNFNRTDSKGKMSLTSTSSVAIIFSGSQWRYLIPETTRAVTSGTSTVESFKLSSTEDMVVSGTRALETRRIVEGKMRVADLRQNEIYDLEFEDVKYENSNCCYPSSGAINAELIDGATMESFVLNFTNLYCGSFELTRSGATTAGTLTRACE